MQMAGSSSSFSSLARDSSRLIVSKFSANRIGVGAGSAGRNSALSGPDDPVFPSTRSAGGRREAVSTTPTTSSFTGDGPGDEEGAVAAEGAETGKEPASADAAATTAAEGAASPASAGEFEIESGVHKGTKIAYHSRNDEDVGTSYTFKSDPFNGLTIEFDPVCDDAQTKRGPRPEPTKRSRADAILRSVLEVVVDFEFPVVLGAFYNRCGCEQHR